MRNTIYVKGARAHNLKNLNVEIPRDKLTVITGVSGSGKTSLAFDVIFGEGQRKFLESMSSYARKRINLVEKADVDSILGLSPVVAIGQKTGFNNPRSTVGTMTDISSYLRLLYATIGVASCPLCSTGIKTKTLSQIADRIQSLPNDTEIIISVPVYKIFNEDYDYMFDEIRSKGYRFLEINGIEHDLSHKIELNENSNHTFFLVIDKIQIKSDMYKRIIKILENAGEMGHGFMRINFVQSESIAKNIIQSFYKDFACLKHNLIHCEQFAYDFSPNIGGSACITCGGLGTYLKAKKELIVINANKTLNQGAINISISRMIESLAHHYNFSLDIPLNELPEDIIDIIFYGTKGEKIEYIPPKDAPKYLADRRGTMASFGGYISQLDRYYTRLKKQGKLKTGSYEWLKRHMVELPCGDCKGQKLNPLKLLVKINDQSIYEIGQLSIENLKLFIGDITIPDIKQTIAEPIINEILKRLDLLLDIGLYYLTLNRRSDSLSGGEAQRLKLATQIGSELMGLLYVLDEPSIGLHPRDISKILTTLKQLRDIGNTVIVVEHDLETIKSADHIIELGPGPGIHGGEICVQGSLPSILTNQKFLTGKFITGLLEIPIPEKRRIANGKLIKILGAQENNLKDLDIDFPLGIFICVTGVSGSGKSSLINDVLYKAIYSKLRDSRTIPGKYKDLIGLENISDIRNIDQSPIGANSRSNPATYVGIYNKIRDLYAKEPEAKKKGYDSSFFSFNSTNGRCNECNGFGEMQTQLSFMPDVRTICPICKGARYKKEVLEIKYHGKSIADILKLSVEEGKEFFSHDHLINHKLSLMYELGLGYIQLGQSATTLSGGESQRIKLSRELSKLKNKTNNLYILDEPTTGLHSSDIKKLLDSINKLVDQGNTVIIVEHNLDVIKCADWIIDLGPEGGERGGYAIFEGTPEDIITTEKSYTGQFLKTILNPIELEVKRK